MKIIAPKRLMESVFPTVRNGGIFNASSLDLQFARTKTLDPRITFTRASSGTYVGADGLIKTATTNEARFDHNPTTGESLGLLVEEQTTNLLLRSEELSNATWAKNFTVATADQAIAPNGTLTADKVAEDSTTNFHAISQYVTGFASGAVASLSIYAKAAGRTKFRIKTDGPGGTGTVDFDLSAVTATSGTGVFSAGSIQTIGNEWYRCSVRCTTSGAGAIGLKVILAATTYGTSYPGDGTSGLYLWGAQLEAGAFPTSYIPTTSSTVTRSADVASITGTNFSSWYRQNEGTVFTKYTNAKRSGRVVEINDNTGNNRHFIATSSNGNNSQFVGSVLGTTFFNSTITDSNNPRNSAYAYKANSYAGVSSGSVPVTSANATIPQVSQMWIGGPYDNGVSGLYFGGTISRLTYFPTRLSDATLQEITR